MIFGAFQNSVQNVYFPHYNCIVIPRKHSYLHLTSPSSCVQCGTLNFNVALLILGFIVAGNWVSYILTFYLLGHEDCNSNLVYEVIDRIRCGYCFSANVKIIVIHDWTETCLVSLLSKLGLMRVKILTLVQ